MSKSGAMEPITRYEIRQLVEAGYEVLIGGSSESLSVAAKAVDGPVVIVESKDAVYDSRGNEVEPQWICFTGLRDGLMVATVGFNRARQGSISRLWDNQSRKKLLRLFVEIMASEA